MFFIQAVVTIPYGAARVMIPSIFPETLSKPSLVVTKRVLDRQGAEGELANHNWREYQFYGHCIFRMAEVGGNAEQSA